MSELQMQPLGEASKGVETYETLRGIKESD